MSDFVVVVLASIAAGLLSLSVALFLLGSERFSSKLIKYGTPFAAGVLLMIAYRDLLPEAIADGGSEVLDATLVAIIVFFLIEKGFKSFHHHHEEDKNKQNDTTQGWLFVIGDVSLLNKSRLFRLNSHSDGHFSSLCRSKSSRLRLCFF